MKRKTINCGVNAM